LVGGASSVLGRPGPRVWAGAALLAALAVYDAVASRLPDLPLWWDVALVAFVLIPATFALVWLALPLRDWRWVGPAGAVCAAVAVVATLADLDVVGNYAKLAAMTLIGFSFLRAFERLSWVVFVALVIPVVDSISVWTGPTNRIVSERPEVFRVLSFAFPVPDFGSFQLGLPDLLFFAVFLGAAARWALRIPLTWVTMTASFGITMALAVWRDWFGIGGLPALPLLCVAFLGSNADLLWRELRRPPPVEPERAG
jgi:hypothetical protein